MTETSSPTTTSRPQRGTIRAEIAGRAIRQVTSFYDASIGSIFGEIYQNARRAGATQVRVDIDLESDTVTVTDNGVGIESPETVLSFGRSGWGRARRRTPGRNGPVLALQAGGRHQLADPGRRQRVAGGPRAQALPWRRDAVVDSLDPSGPSGTTVTFPITENDECPETAP